MTIARPTARSAPCHCLLLVLLLPNPSWAGEQAKLTASDAAGGDVFGLSVSLSGDTALVGARFDADGGVDSGSAYVFVRNGGVWTEQAKLTASDASAGDQFGYSVCIEGDWAVVTAAVDEVSGPGSGSAYVFERSGTVWTERAKLTPLDGGAGDQFGNAVSLSGNTVVVGAWRDDDVGADSGSAYVFVRAGMVWTEQAKLLASDGIASDAFGVSVSVSGDTVVVGAPPGNAAYVFTRSGQVWTEQARLMASDGNPTDFFGFDVSVFGDTAVVGAYRDADLGTDTGSAYVFDRNGMLWTEVAKLTAADAAAGASFGYSVSLVGDVVVVGSPVDDASAPGSGSAYVFERIGMAWSEQAKLTASDGARDDRLAIAASLSGTTALLGAHLDDDAGSRSGSAYVFEVAACDAPPREIPPTSVRVTRPGNDVFVDFDDTSFPVFVSFNVYRGPLVQPPAFDQHVVLPGACGLPGTGFLDLGEAVQPGGRYYLVTAACADSLGTQLEGPYGTDSTGMQRSVAVAPCP